MARNYTHIIAVIIIVFMVTMRNYMIVSGAVCPDNTMQLSPTPVGFGPAGSVVCVDNDHNWNISISYEDSDTPCGQVIVDNNPAATLTGEYDEVVLRPEMNNTGSASVQFEYAFFGAVVGLPIDEGIIFELKVFDASSNFLYSQSFNSDGVGTVTDGLRVGGVGFSDIYYFLAVVELPSFETGNFITLKPLAPPVINVSEYWLQGVKFAPYVPVTGNTITTPCFGDYTIVSPPPITLTPSPTFTPLPTFTPGGPTPPPTPTPTITPTPDLTPSITPTFPPTAIGGTPSPLPSNTPVPIVTIPPLDTPTLIPVGAISTLDIPIPSTIEIGQINTPVPFGQNLTPNATSIAIASTLESYTDDVIAVATEYATIADLSLLDVDQPSVISATMVLAADVAAPFSWLRTIKYYMPNTWPLIYSIIIMMSWIMFMIVAKFIVAIVSEVIEIIRKILELIPFM